MLTWLAGPSRGLLLISRQEGYLPPFLQKLNKNGVQQNILVTQGVITTLIGLGYALIPTVSSAYWVFSVITTQVYLIMYLLMFVAAVRLRRRSRSSADTGPRCSVLSAGSGSLHRGGAAHRLHPPSQFESGSGGVYLAIVGGGARPRTPCAVPLLQVPQTVVEAAGADGGEPVMSTVQETSTPRDRRIVYAVIAGALVLLLVVCLVFYRRASRTKRPRKGRPADRGTASRCTHRPIARADRRRAR